MADQPTKTSVDEVKRKRQIQLQALRNQGRNSLNNTTMQGVTQAQLNQNAQQNQNTTIQANMGQASNDLQGYLGNMPTREKIEKMNYEDAQTQAGERLNPMYENQEINLKKNMDNDAVRRGFFGQLPNEALQRYRRTELDNQKASDVAGLAQDIQDRSLQEALALRQSELAEESLDFNKATGMYDRDVDKERFDKTWDRDETRYQQEWDRDETRYDTDQDWKERAWIRDEERYETDQEWKERTWDREGEWRKEDTDFRDKEFAFNQKVTAAQMTGKWDGKKTISYEKMLHDMGMDKKQLALSTKQANASISQGWSRISQANKQFNYGKEQDKKAYETSVRNQAFENAMKELNPMGLPNAEINDTQFQKAFQRNLDRLTGETKSSGSISNYLK